MRRVGGNQRSEARLAQAIRDRPPIRGSFLIVSALGADRTITQADADFMIEVIDEGWPESDTFPLYVGFKVRSLSVSGCLILTSGFQFRWIQTLWTRPSKNMQITTKVPE